MTVNRRYYKAALDLSDEEIDYTICQAQRVAAIATLSTTDILDDLVSLVTKTKEKAQAKKAARLIEAAIKNDVDTLRSVGFETVSGKKEIKRLVKKGGR
jgi:hypothetical protein